MSFRRSFVCVHVMGLWRAVGYPNVVSSETLVLLPAFLCVVNLELSWLLLGQYRSLTPSPSIL